jgi:hypothetical protein
VRGAPTLAVLAAALAAAAIACSNQHGDRVSSREAPAILQPPAPPSDAAVIDGSTQMSSDPNSTRGALPQALADRLGELVSAPLPSDVVLSLADIGRTKDPSLNVRWQLTDDGRLFLVRHSGAGGDRSVAFDRPLPATPTATLPAAEVAALRDAVEDAGLFDHPGYEEQRASGGTLLVVRARGARGVHTVVLVNVRSPLTERLQAVARDHR